MKISDNASYRKTIIKKRFRGDGVYTLIFLTPYVILFTVFYLIPILLSFILSFTNFNSVQPPEFVGLSNYIAIFTQDRVLMQYVLPNTLTLAIILGPIGFILQFLLAWMLAHLPRISRTVLSFIFYSPSLTGGIALGAIWKVLFSGDQNGYINSLLLRFEFIESPINFTGDPKYLLGIVIIITLWSSMGIGFLSIMAGILSYDPEIYEAAYVDGLSNRFQEIIYITIPAMKPAMMFAAVMCIVNTFSVGQVAIDLAGANPTPSYSAQTFYSHILDRWYNMYEMGYASALSIVLLIIVFLISQIAQKLFVEKQTVDKRKSKGIFRFRDKVKDKG